ncbi:MAG: hypothetical protein LM571_01255 [Desulfurococcaceae archaeon]|nr:hypothetical protein [Desulfurococcaceae archaeon]
MNNQVFDAVRDVAKTLDVLVDFMKCLEIDPGEMLWHLGDKPCWSSDLVST